MCNHLHQCDILPAACKDGLHVPAYARALAQMLSAMCTVVDGVTAEQLRAVWQCQYGGAHEAVTRSILHIFHQSIPLMNATLRRAVIEWSNNALFGMKMTLIDSV